MSAASGLPPLPGPHAVGFVDCELPPAAPGGHSVHARVHYPCDAPGARALTPWPPRWLPHRSYVYGTLAFLSHNDPPASSLARAALTALLRGCLGAVALLLSLTTRLRHLHPAAPLASAASAGRLLPVVILSHGLGGMRSSYSGLASQLASAGFLVVALEHTDGTACAHPGAGGAWRGYEGAGEPRGGALLGGDGDAAAIAAARAAKVAHRVAEIRAVADAALALAPPPGGAAAAAAAAAAPPLLAAFAGRVDGARVSVLGHSFGGAAALSAAASDARLCACVALDPWMAALSPDDACLRGRWPHPARALVLLSAAWAATGPGGRPVGVPRLRAALDGCAAAAPAPAAASGRPSASCAAALAVRGTSHLSFGDALALLPPAVARLALAGDRAAAGPGAAITAVAAAAAAFLAAAGRGGGGEGGGAEAGLGAFAMPLDLD